jgi:hypothetical protein
MGVDVFGIWIIFAIFYSGTLLIIKILVAVKTIAYISFSKQKMTRVIELVDI